jgi:hypothetical protein
LYEKTIARFIDKNHLSSKIAPHTDGNLFKPVTANTGIHGGWREKRLRADRMNMVIGATAAGLAAVIGAGYVLSKKSRA